MCPFLPDSPRLLIRKGKHEEALEVIAALEGHGATPESPAVITQYNIIKDILDREQMNTYMWWQLLSGKGPNGVLRRMCLGAWMQAMNQISGINVSNSFPRVEHGRLTPGTGHQLLQELHLHQLTGHIRTSGPNLSRRRISRLPHLRLSGILCHRAVWTAQSYDVLCCRLLDLLDCDCCSTGSDRGWRRLLQARHRSCVVLLPVLR